MVILNGQSITEEELEKIRESLKEDTAKKQKKLVEVAPGEYKILEKLDE